MYYHRGKNMKKIIAILVVGVFLLSGLGAVAVSEVDEKLVMKNQIKLSKLSSMICLKR